jgi:hypothetical protein
MFGGSLPLLKTEPLAETPSILSIPQEEKKADFPPPINSLFSFDLPGLAQKSKNADKYNLSSLESNAKNYLDSMKEDEPDLVPLDLGASKDSKHDFNQILTDPPRGMFPSSIMANLGKKAEPQARQSMTPLSAGDMISSKYHTYNSIGTLAPMVLQDENLSLTLNSPNVKMFLNPDQKASIKNLIFLIENSKPSDGSVEVSNNISFLVNQTE